MILPRNEFYFIFLLIITEIKPNNLLRPLTVNLNKVSNESLMIKELIKTLRMPNLPNIDIPKLTNHLPIPPSAINEFQASWDDEDVDLNITQLINKNGYQVEKHEVTTSDGYILTMFRIPNDGPPVLLMHGLLSSSDDWTTNGRNSSFSYLLADRGYDVWLGNARGSQHSRKHIHLDPEVDEDEFWDFSWDEIGRYDLPAKIDYILDATCQQQLIYVGHSQGVTSFCVLCSEKPEYNKKLLFMAAFSTPVFMANTFSPTLRLLSPPAYDEDAPLVKAIGPQIFAKDTVGAFKRLLCNSATNVVSKVICTSLVFLVLGFNYEQAHYKRLGTMLKHFANGSATKQLQHYAQSIVDGQFRQFNYKAKNEKVYGRKSPPHYPLENISVPMEIFHGKNDWLSHRKDLETLLDHLNTNYTVHEVSDPSFAHLDYLIAKDVTSLLYDDVLRLIDEKSSIWSYTACQ